eukprot:scaffold4934_cov128-Isochrysis_galbana.AAC.5
MKQDYGGCPRAKRTTARSMGGGSGTFCSVGAPYAPRPPGSRGVCVYRRRSPPRRSKVRLLKRTNYKQPADRST